MYFIGIESNLQQQTAERTLAPDQSGALVRLLRIRQHRGGLVLDGQDFIDAVRRGQGPPRFFVFHQRGFGLRRRSVGISLPHRSPTTDVPANPPLRSGEDIRTRSQMHALAREREARILRLRKQGLTLDAIADQLGSFS
jgi:hypothetical protein